MVEILRPRLGDSFNWGYRTCTAEENSITLTRAKYQDALVRSFGEDLRSEREARGITLEDISASSRIPVPVLEAIERDEFDRLPGGLFNVSFVRQYASAVGLNQDEVVDAFAKACATSSGDPDHPPPVVTALAVEGEDRGQMAARFAEGLTDYLRRNSVLLSAGLGVLGLVLLSLAVFYSPNESAQQADADSSYEGARQVELEYPSVPPVPQQESRALPAKPSVPAKQAVGLQVGLRVTDTVWVRATRDGRLAWEYTLRAGQKKLITAHESIALIVGNAGGVALTLNGQAVPPIGERGQVRRVVFTPAGMSITRPPPRRRRRAAASDDLAVGSRPFSVVAEPVLAHAER